MFDPTWPKYSTPYTLDNIPIPPPPPKQSHKGLVVALIILSCLVVVLGGWLFAVIHFSSQQPISPTSSTLTPTVLLNRTPASQSKSSYFPVFLSSYSPPQAGLPYTSTTVYDTFLAVGIKMNTVQYNDGWSCCVAYQPEGKIVSWEESYGVVVEIATFATPTEAETDANDLLTNSSGFSVYTRNLCLLFYDNSISNTSLAHYITAMSVACK